MNRTQSLEEWKRAQKVLPGGVNSPVRSYNAVEGDPPFIDSGSGCLVRDIDGNEYIDYVMSWGPLILGHRHKGVIDAARAVLERGTTFGAPTVAETDLGELLVHHVPSMESVRLVSSGTEATMSALRLARGFTGREGIVKFDGCYHGHADSLLVEAGSGPATLSIAGSVGVPDRMIEKTWSTPFNDEQSFVDLLNARGDEIAVVIAEPVPGNMGVVPPRPGFLEMIRKETASRGILLLFDEVISGFRLGLGGAQDRFGITPDLTALGKIIGGGLPLGAYGGRREIMEHLAPLGGVYQAGTLSGNPLAVAAGIATVSALAADPPYERLERLGRLLGEGLQKRAVDAGLPARYQAEGTMMSFFFSEEEVVDYEGAKGADQILFSRYHRAMLNEGVYLPPSQYEAYFLSTAHDQETIDRTLRKAERVFGRIASTGQ